MPTTKEKIESILLREFGACNDILVKEIIEACEADASFDIPQSEIEAAAEKACYMEGPRAEAFFQSGVEWALQEINKPLTDIQ